ncbi:MAG TPA: glycoside hydrolase family 15 protein, partial [Candidatus Competibacteraceae bacterium]|nr:glycoside hydrolase family 15 protein [Candidatus Competibacteraceae bacterium]
PADDIAQARTLLQSLLPRESVSRETDAALLNVIGFPAYAVEDTALMERTRAVILSRLQGFYGYKRFPGDAHLPQLKNRAHTPAAKLGENAVVEPEWPLFFAFLLVDGALRGEWEQSYYYRQRLEALLVERQGHALLPECYYRPASRMPLEPAIAGKPRYLPAGNLPLLWGQSLYLLGLLLQEGYISPADIDPLGRRHRTDRRRPTLVRLALLAEDNGVAAQLAALGLPAQTLQEVQPLQIRPAAQLEACFRELGRNNLLGLPGRSLRPLGSLTTCHLFTLPTGESTVFLPAFLARRDFYLSLDNRLLTARLRTELSYIYQHWAEPGPPVLTFLVSEPMLRSCGQQVLLALLQECQAGRCNGVPIKLGKPGELLVGAARLNLPLAPPGEPLDAPPDRHSPLHWSKLQTHPLASARAALLRQESEPGRLLGLLFNSRNLYEQIELLGLLWEKLGPDFKTAPGVTLRELTEWVYDEAGVACLWSVVRRAAGRLDMLDPGLEDAVAEILLHQHYVSVGRAYSHQAVITQPLGNREIMDRLRAYGGDDSRCRALLQELILFLGLLIKADPGPFAGITTLRPRHLLLLMTGALAREWRITRGEACEVLLKLSPNAILTRLRQVLTDQKALRCSLAPLESLHYQGKLESSVNPEIPTNDNISLVGNDIWNTWREISGVQPRLDDDFFQRVRTVLEHCRGVVIGDQLDPRNYLDNQLTTPELPISTFAAQVEYLLNAIQGPAYRQLNIEALTALADILAANPELRVEDYLVLDVLIGTAVQLYWREANPGLTYSDYNEHCSEAWGEFYSSPPHRAAAAIAAALSFLLEGQERQAA